MKPPVCKVCQKAHWTYDGHFVSTETVPDYVKEMAKGALGYEKTIVVFPDKRPPEMVTTTASTEVSPQELFVPTDVPTCECGKPKDGRHAKCAACRKRAYRERSR